MFGYQVVGMGQSLCSPGISIGWHTNNTNEITKYRFQVLVEKLVILLFLPMFSGVLLNLMLKWEVVYRHRRGMLIASDHCHMLATMSRLPTFMLSSCHSKARAWETCWLVVNLYSYKYVHLVIIAPLPVKSLVLTEQVDSVPQIVSYLIRNRWSLTLPVMFAQTNIFF